MNPKRGRRRLGAAAIATFTLTGLAATYSPLATASIAQSTVAIEDPVNYTPNVQDDAVVANAYVYKLTPVGSTMFVGGNFNTVTNSTRTTTYTRRSFFSFDISTGAVSALHPLFNGAVWAIEPSPDGKLFIGGDFTSVNGVTVNHLVKLDPATGLVDPTFAPTITVGGNVTDLRMVAGRLITAGSYGKKLRALNPTTGADTGFLKVVISGKVPNATAPVKVFKFAVSPDGSRLVGIGNFASVGGQRRYHAFALDLTTSSVSTVTAWTSPRFDPDLHRCINSEADYMRDVDFSPDGSYIVFATTGYRDPADPKHPGTITKNSMCDVAARFENRDASVDWTWVNRTGGDSLYSVAATGAAVYIGGHERWANNPDGEDFAGPGAVSRPGVGALDPVTGLALAWNPTTSLGAGMREITPTPSGVWFGHDAHWFHKEWRWGITFTPLS
jgi:hypothetical protein